MIVLVKKLGDVDGVFFHAAAFALHHDAYQGEIGVMGLGVVNFNLYQGRRINGARDTSLITTLHASDLVPQKRKTVVYDFDTIDQDRP